MSGVQFDLFEGERRRDDGIWLVSMNNLDWLGNALDVVQRHAPHDREFMAEEFRNYPGIGTPRHENTWGALTRTAILQRIIVATGRTAKARSPGNHAHRYMIYRRR